MNAIRRLPAVGAPGRVATSVEPLLTDVPPSVVLTP
jgi:hypothetical protein